MIALAAEPRPRLPLTDPVASGGGHAVVTLARWEGSVAAEVEDAVAVEEPLQIRLNGRDLVVTMRTPGQDFALAAGFLYTEGLITDREQISGMAYCENQENPELRNVVQVYLEEARDTRGSFARTERHFTAMSSCGLCGKTSIEAVRCLAPPIEERGMKVPPEVIRRLPGAMRAAQQTFQRTGGLHAAALFDPQGSLLALQEDIGRHNALDKLIGAELLAGRTSLYGHVLLVSGRTSFEILQKAAVARIPVVCAVSAPSSLAVQLAQALNITLVGFLRGESMNVYSGAQRIGG